MHRRAAMGGDGETEAAAGCRRWASRSSSKRQCPRRAGRQDGHDGKDVLRDEAGHGADELSTEGPRQRCRVTSRADSGWMTRHGGIPLIPTSVLAGQL